MKVTIFTGTIVLNYKDFDIKKSYIIERLKYLVNYDISIEIITPEINPSERIIHKNLKYNTYKIIHISKYLSATIFSLSKLVELESKIIHCYSHQAAFIALIANLFRKKKYKIIFEPMGLASEEAKLENSFKIKFFRPFTTLIERVIFDRSDYVIVYTFALRNYIFNKFKLQDTKNIYIVPHGISLTPTQVEISYSPRFERLNIPINYKKIVYAGSLSKLNGTLHLMKTIKYVFEKKHDVAFIIIGNGRLENTLIQYVEMNKLSNVFLLGYIPHEEIPHCLILADILLIPHSKCMQTELDPPTKLFEYLKSGKPIVSFNLKAIAEVAGKEAILVEPDDPQAMSDGILELLNNEKLAEELGRKGKEIADKYSWEESAIHQYEAYKSIDQIIKSDKR